MATITLDMFTTIVKIEVVGTVLVLECKTGVGGTQTGVPPMTISGTGIGSRSVFASSPLKVGKATLITPQGLKITSQTGTVFLFCNLGALRAAQKSKTIKLLITTPPGANQQPVPQNYYWVYQPNISTGPFIPTLNPFFPLPGGPEAAESVWADTIGAPGSQNVLIATHGTNTLTGQYLNSIFPSTGSLPGFFSYLVSIGGNPFSVIPATFLVQPPDSTSWLLRAGIWKKKADVQITTGDTWPLPPPAIQPTSQAATGGGPPSKVVTVTVSPAPANIVSLS